MAMGYVDTGAILWGGFECAINDAMSGTTTWYVMNSVVVSRRSMLKCVYWWSLIFIAKTHLLHVPSLQSGRVMRVKVKHSKYNSVVDTIQESTT